MTPLAAIRVHPSRAEQVRRIAAARGLTIAGAIERFITAEIKAGTIPADLPGFEVQASRDDTRGPIVTLTLEGLTLPAMKPKTVEDLADLIEHLATTRGRDAGAKMELTDGTVLAIGRKGTGIVMRATRKGAEPILTTLTFSMAADLCRSLHSAALAAQYATA